MIQKFLRLPDDKQQRLCDSMGELLTKLKADCDSNPENAGKTVAYAELWAEYAQKMNMAGEVPEPLQQGVLPIEEGVRIK